MFETEVEVSQEQIGAWLRAIGCTPVEETDPNAEWHVHIDYPPKAPNIVHVVIPKAKRGVVVIVSALQVDHRQLEAFERLDDEAKADFMFELRMKLNTPDTEFNFEGVTSPNECPERITINAARFADGLTLDSFARTVSAVFKSQFNATLLLQHHLAGDGHIGGGRFDFKRLGLQ